jgi:hypothetical protein
MRPTHDPLTLLGAMALVVASSGTCGGGADAPTFAFDEIPSACPEPGGESLARLFSAAESSGRVMRDQDKAPRLTKPELSVRGSVPPVIAFEDPHFADAGEACRDVAYAVRIWDAKVGKTNVERANQPFYSAVVLGTVFTPDPGVWTDRFGGNAFEIKLDVMSARFHEGKLVEGPFGAPEPPVRQLLP